MLAILGVPSRFSGVLEWIRRRGLVVDIVMTAAEGMHTHATAGADLVLLGLPLPDRGSAALIKALRETDPSTTIIVAGIDGDIRSQLKALELGADEFVSDPIEGRKDLLFAIGITLGMRKGDAQLRVLRMQEAAGRPGSVGDG